MVILDNLSSHNPIEMSFSQLKAHLRKAKARTIDAPEITSSMPAMLQINGSMLELAQSVWAAKKGADRAMEG